MTIEELKERTRPLLGKNRLITIAYTAKSPKQAADVSRRLGLEESVTKAIRFAAIILRDHGKKVFEEIFEPFEVYNSPSSASSLKFTLKLHDARKGSSDYLNPLELEYVSDEIAKVLDKLHIEYQLDLSPAPRWLGNRILKEFSKG